jgi:hypothetical protein
MARRRFKKLSSKITCVSPALLSLSKTTKQHMDDGETVPLLSSPCCFSSRENINGTPISLNVLYTHVSVCCAALLSEIEKVLRYEPGEATRLYKNILNHSHRSSLRVCFLKNRDRLPYVSLVLLVPSISLRCFCSNTKFITARLMCLSSALCCFMQSKLTMNLKYVAATLKHSCYGIHVFPRPLLSEISTRRCMSLSFKRRELMAMAVVLA